MFIKMAWHNIQTYFFNFFNENGKHAPYKIRVPTFLHEHMLITNKENKWQRDGSKQRKTEKEKEYVSRSHYILTICKH